MVLCWKKREGRVRIQDCRPLLNVADMDASLAFWRDVLGFEVTFAWENEGRVAFARLSHGGAELMLNRPGEIERPGPGEHPSYADAVLSFRVDDAHALAGALSAKGWPSEGPTREMYGDELLVRDPSGYQLAFVSEFARVAS
jgi:catechol 2,3-dioxygenase-like lactoylglutathione lyase family enzyme